MTNVEISAVFEQVADLLEFQNVNPFRVRAYRNASRVVRDLAEPLAEIVSDPSRKLTDIDGIGKDLADKITTLVETQQLPLLIELQAEIPQSVLALLRIPGLGPKKAAALHRELGIVNLEQVREACAQQRVRGLKGFGAKTEELILAGLAFAEQSGQRIYWAQADAFVQAIKQDQSAPGSQFGAEIVGKFTQRSLGQLLRNVLPECVGAEFDTGGRQLCGEVAQHDVDGNERSVAPALLFRLFFAIARFRGNRRGQHLQIGDWIA